MELEELFPVWDQLSGRERDLLLRSAAKREVRKGSLLHGGNADCVGIVGVCSGRLRAYILSDEGREITLFRLQKGELCLLSASCMVQNIRFDVTIEAETDAQLIIVPAEAYRQLMDGSAVVANFTNRLMASRLSEVMWLIEQVLWKSVDMRLAAFLVQESELEQSDILCVTHEKIAGHLGTAREVVTRMLRYFQSEGMVRLSRGTVALLDEDRLKALAAEK